MSLLSAVYNSHATAVPQRRDRPIDGRRPMGQTHSWANAWTRFCALVGFRSALLDLHMTLEARESTGDAALPGRVRRRPSECNQWLRPSGGLGGGARAPLAGRHRRRSSGPYRHHLGHYRGHGSRRRQVEAGCRAAAARLARRPLLQRVALLALDERCSDHGERAQELRVAKAPQLCMPGRADRAPALKQRDRTGGSSITTTARSSRTCVGRVGMSHT